MKRDSREARAASFGGVADMYERSRPSYPLPAVRWLVGDAPVDVLDLGAGTGKLTRDLVAIGHRVIAVDPSSEMLGQLRRALPLVPSFVGTAEAIPLPNASVNVVTVAQALHWFDLAVALPEIARVLRLGGVLATVWNVRDESVPWVAQLSDLIGSEHYREPHLTESLAESGLFAAPTTATFEHAVIHDRASLVELVRSRSYCAVRDGVERAEILVGVERLYDASAGEGGLELSYRTECSRAIRR
jgi:ubiquinone/menaquinone biosynthesis C-methylase UbiE